MSEIQIPEFAKVEITASGDTATAVVANAKEVFEKHLEKHGVDAKQIKGLSDASKEFTAGLLEHVGKAGIEFMATNKEVEKVVSSVKVSDAAGTYEVGVKRSATSRNPKTGEEMVSHGVPFVSHKVSYGKTSSSTFASVKETLKALGAEKLK